MPLQKWLNFFKLQLKIDSKYGEINIVWLILPLNMEKMQKNLKSYYLQVILHEDEAMSPKTLNPSSLFSYYLVCISQMWSEKKWFLIVKGPIFHAMGLFWGADFLHLLQGYTRRDSGNPFNTTLIHGDINVNTLIKTVLLGQWSFMDLHNINSWRQDKELRMGSLASYRGFVQNWKKKKKGERKENGVNLSRKVNCTYYIKAKYFWNILKN